MRNKTLAEHDHDRTEILRYLKECQFMPVTPVTLVRHMDDIFHPVTDEGMEFHLRYMFEKGWVQMNVEAIAGKRPKVVWAKLTAAGLDEFNRRAPGDTD